MTTEEDASSLHPRAATREVGRMAPWLDTATCPLAKKQSRCIFQRIFDKKDYSPAIEVQGKLIQQLVWSYSKLVGCEMIKVLFEQR